LKMDLTEGSETSAQLISLTPGKYPKESIHDLTFISESRNCNDDG
jgi:hypothetical protein